MATASKCDCLLPTGLMVSIDLGTVRTLNELKSELWREAQKLPFFQQLGAANTYGFEYVSRDGDLREVPLEDEAKTKHKDIGWFEPLLKVVKLKGDKAEQKMALKIGKLIGKPLREFENCGDEVSAFRRNILAVCDAAIRKRRAGGRQALEEFTYPPAVDLSPLQPGLRKKLSGGNQLTFQVAHEGAKKVLSCKIEDRPERIIETIIKPALEKSGVKMTAEHVLKVPGREEYLISGHSLENTSHVRRSLAETTENVYQVEFELVLRKSMPFPSDAEMKEITAREDKLLDRPLAHDSEPSVPPDDLWSGKHSTTEYTIKVVDASQLKSAAAGKLFGIKIMAQVFLGDTPLKLPVYTRTLPVATEVTWNETLRFESLQLKNLPRDAKLCISLYGLWINPLKMKRKKKKFKNEQPLAWFNVSVFDHNGLLKQGTLANTRTWLYPSDDEDQELMIPKGTTMANADSDMAAVSIELMPGIKEQIKFPPVNTLGGKEDGRVQDGVDPAILSAVEIVTRKDPLFNPTHEDKENLRKYKYYFKDSEVALSKCLAAVDWTRNEAAHEVVDMLRHWAKVQPEEALDLLDSSFADATTRNYAVECLFALNDDMLLAYMLQLVQVLKYEPYLDCKLSRFLLERALRNQRIGHFFFWYLRAEMHNADSSVRYGLLLEAYCRGCGSHMEKLQVQVDTLDQLVNIAVSIKPSSVKSKSRVPMVTEGLKSVMVAPGGKKVQPMSLPYDPSIQLGSVKCPRVMDSKKLPLWLTFDNADSKVASLAPKDKQINVIFKAGDDLRQDMLTLQLIRIMDNLWKAQDLDLKMNAYECLSTGNEVGLLQVVMNAATIASIQGSAMGARKDDPLFKWLKKENPGEKLDLAVENFMKSCAGYCVATYILGIGDRHNDNIMVTKDGRLFHIDFGHFLGNWKSKFGIKRERVKVILTPDFVYAMTKADGRMEKSPVFKQFKEIAVQAYMIVRKNANLFINLLNMMLSTGIPELQSHDDVRYLRNTLCLDMTDDEAKVAFGAELDKALKDSWSVRVNWAIHIAAH